MSEQPATADARIAIIAAPFDCEEIEQPVGKRLKLDAAIEANLRELGYGG